MRSIFFLTLFINFISYCKPVKSLPLPENPKRIAVLNSLAANLLWRFGERYRKKVVALPNTIDDVRYSDMVGVWPKNIPRISGSLEAILFSKPDLAILANFNSVVLQGALSKLNVPYILLNKFTGFDDYLFNVKKVAEAVKAPKEEKRLIKVFYNRLEKIHKVSHKLSKIASHSKRLKKSLKLNCLSYFNEGFLGLDTGFHDIVEAAGLVNIAALKKVKGFKRASLEEIIFLNPDVLVIGCSFKNIQNCRQAEKTFKLKYKQLKSVKAYQNNLIVALPYPFLTSIQESMLKASEMLQDHILNR